MEVKAIETVPVLVVAPLFTVVPEAVGEIVVSGGVVSTVTLQILETKLGLPAKSVILESGKTILTRPSDQAVNIKI